MIIRNETDFEVATTFGTGQDNQPCIAFIVKATFRLPQQIGETPTLAGQQLPIAAAAEYFDGDSSGSVSMESDMVTFKPYADIVVSGTAYAPGGRPSSSVDVLVRVGQKRKVLRIFGDRQWIFPSRMVMKPVMSDPEPFTEMPIIYERAFGGIDGDAGKHCTQNLIGRGYLGKKTKESVHETRLPNVEDPTRLISSWKDKPMPAGLGFYGRAWQPRAALAGSEEGFDNAHPFFGTAEDFNPAFNNGAHPDLQVAHYLSGDEEVELINLTPDRKRRFQLPGIRPALTIERYDEPPDIEDPDVLEAIAAVMNEDAPADLEGAVQPQYSLEMDQQDVAMHLDTLVFLADDDLFYMVWRGQLPVGPVITEDDMVDAFLRLAKVHVHLE